MTKSTRSLRFAPVSPCPHCGRPTRTTSDGICADCWGSKGGRPLLVRRGGQGPPGWFPFNAPEPFALAVVLVLAAAVLVVVKGGERVGLW